MLEPERQEDKRKDLANSLKALRRAAGLPGERLAARCAMSQSKISRIERGKVLPTVLDVELILNALDVPATVVDELLALARVANVDYTSWREHARIGLWKNQLQLKTLTEASTVVRQFLPAIPTGILQTAEYAREVFTNEVEGDVERDVERAVQARMERQAALNDTSRKFIFIMTEQAIRWRRANREIMLGQIEHTIDVSQRPNVEMAILPQASTIQATPLNVFLVFDERLVIAELFSGEVVLRDPRDVLYHLNLFQFFLGHSITGNDMIEFLRSVADEFRYEGR